MINYHTLMSAKYPHLQWTINGVSYEDIEMNNKPSRAEMDAAWAEVQFDSNKSKKLKSLKDAAEKAISSLVGNYSDKEQKTFAKQEAEARAWDADNLSPTPFLDAYCAASNIQKDVAVASILAKAAQFEVATGHIIGKVKAKRKLIEDATTLADLEDITVEIAMG